MYAMYMWYSSIRQVRLIKEANVSFLEFKPSNNLLIVPVFAVDSFAMNANILAYNMGG